MKIEDIIAESLRTGTDITPDDRKEWALFACALKVLGFDEDTFVRLSTLHGTPPKNSRKVWRGERNPAKYIKTVEQAERKVAYFAKQAGLNLKKRWQQPSTCRLQTRPPRNIPASDPRQTAHIYVKMKEVATASEYVQLTSLFNFLCRHFRVEEVNRVMRMYKVGSTREFGKIPGMMGTAYPYINGDGKCVDVKLMAYDNNGHRKKHGYSTNWVLSKKGMNERRAPWALFGEHLLASRPSDPVGVVESEKTALIASIALPGYVWIATGSKQNLNPERCKALKGRDVYLFPDADGVEEWNRRGLELAKAKFNIYDCSSMILEQTQSPKDDIADIILHYKKSTKAS